MEQRRGPFALDAELTWHTAMPGIERKVLTYQPDIMMVHFRFAAGIAAPEHAHPHVQCSYIAGGSFDVTIDGHTRRLTQGDSYLVPANARHSATSIGPGEIIDVFAPLLADLL